MAGQDCSSEESFKLEDEQSHLEEKEKGRKRKRKGGKGRGEGGGKRGGRRGKRREESLSHCLGKTLISKGAFGRKSLSAVPII